MERVQGGSSDAAAKPGPSQASPRRVYLLTGATGFVGKLVLESLLRRREQLGIERIVALVRPQGPLSAERRFQRSVAGAACLAHLPADWRAAVDVVAGDLAAPGLGLSPESAEALRTGVTHVVHGAAAVAFDLPLAEATTANVDATLHLLEFAKGCRRLQNLVAVSTAYVSPHPGDGVPIEERPAALPAPADRLHRAILAGEAREKALLAASGHPNTYTLTKCLAEHRLLAERDGLPLVIVRPSIVSACWRAPFPGWIDSGAAFAAFVALVGMGHLRVVVGDPEARLDLVPVDWVAERIVEASGETPPPDAVPIRHAVAGLARSPRIGECRDRIVRFYRANRVGRRPTVRYLGPDGPRFRWAERRHHALPLHLAMLRSPRARGRVERLLDQLQRLNRIFPYFTSRSFDFRSSIPFDPPGWNPGEYVTEVCRGVRRHLLRPERGGRAERPRAEQPVLGGS